MPDVGTQLYLDLLKKTLTNVIYEDPAVPGQYSGPAGYDARRRANGKDWPSVAHTMVGLKRLDNIQDCIEKVLADDIPGDFIETGVWRGGSAIFMRGVLAAYGVTDRTVWVADSFQGMPATGPDGNPIDRAIGLDQHNDVLAVPLETVQENFDRYGLLDKQVRFLPGWFSDTLPSAPIDKLAVARLDGDLYSSTMDALTSLYPKLSTGGYLIIDDYMTVPSCRHAAERYWAENQVDGPMELIDSSTVCMRRAA